MFKKFLEEIREKGCEFSIKWNGPDVRLTICNRNLEAFVDVTPEQLEVMQNGSFMKNLVDQVIEKTMVEIPFTVASSYVTRNSEFAELVRCSYIDSLAIPEPIKVTTRKLEERLYGSKS